jgi:hypothetical protein
MHSLLRGFAEIEALFRGKSTILVGPANNLIGLNLGQFIDSHDIVCRLNDSYIISESRQKDYGNKCDVLLNTCNCELLCIMRRFSRYLNNCELVINPTSKVHKSDYINTQKNVFENYLDTKLTIPFYQVEGDFAEVMSTYGLNTGMCALNFLSSLPLKYLYICGFSFHGVTTSKYVRGDIVSGYETYLFDFNDVYTCKTACDPNSPCRRRVDPRHLSKKDELYQLQYFENNFLDKDNIIVDESVLNATRTNLVSKRRLLKIRDFFWR